MNGDQDRAREFIERFRREKYKLDDEQSWKKSDDRLLEDLTNAVEQLSKGLYEKDIHFLLELIQNAEDNTYGDALPELQFVLLDSDPTKTPGSEGCLCIFNNEVGFTEKNIESISSVGKSTKSKAEGYIGEKGIGFKSVFIVSSAPHIYSNGFAIKFLEDDPEFILRYIVPYWLESVPSIVLERKANTSILLPLKPGRKQLIIEHLSNVKAETILFLKKLEGISIEINATQLELQLARSTSKSGITELLVEQNPSKVELKSYWLFSQKIIVPSDLKEEKREGVKERDVTIAFPMTESAIYGTVYAFLPTEVDSGLPFLINADFMLTANRESIQVEREWNIWIQEQIATTVVQAILLRIKAEPKDHGTYSFIPVPGTAKMLQNYFNPIAEQVVSELSQHTIVIDDLGRLENPTDIYFCPKRFRELVSSEFRPEWFDVKSITAPGLDIYKRQLVAIGVRDLRTADVLEWLDDVKWLAEQRSGWFVMLYRALSSDSGGNKKELAKKSIIPVEGGGLARPADRIYWSNNEDLTERLIAMLPQALSSDIYFTESNFSSELIQYPEAYSWAEEKLDIKEFSLNNYLQKSLLPWLSKESKVLDVDLVIQATQFILSKWDELVEETRDMLSEHVPIVLDSSEISLIGDLSGSELVAPRAFNPKAGWQILLDEADCSELDVLSDLYINKANDNLIKPLTAFFEAIGATQFPDFPSIEYGGSYHEKLDEYVEEILDNARRKSTRTPRFRTWIAPSTFILKEVRKNRRYRNALLHWLDAMLENRSLSIRNGTVEWFYRCAYADMVESSLYRSLTQTPWLKTTKGFGKPREIFLKTKQAKELFGDRLPYLEDKMSSEVAEFLGVKTDVTAEALIGLLAEYSSSGSTVKLSLLEKIYKYLDELDELEIGQFESEPLIFVGDQEKRWCRISETVWRDSSEALGSTWGWLSGIYSAKLRSFFVNKLRVAEDVDDEAFCQAWLRVQDEDANKERVETFLSTAMPRMSAAFSDDKQPEWKADFIDRAKIWTKDRDWQDPSNVYVGDDQRLSNLFKDHIYLVWKPEAPTHASLRALYTAAGVARLSESVTYSIDNTPNSEHIEANRFLTEHSKWLLCYAMANTGKDGNEMFDQQVSEGLIGTIVALEEVIVDELVVEASIDEQAATVELTDSYAFIDLDNRWVFIKRDCDEDDVKDDLAESLARTLWGSQRFKEHVEKVVVLLGVTNEKRYRKLRDRHAWHLSHAKQGLLRDLFAQDGESSETQIGEVEKLSESDSIVVEDTPSNGISEIGVTEFEPPLSVIGKDSNTGIKQEGRNTQGRAGSSVQQSIGGTSSQGTADATGNHSATSTRQRSQASPGRSHGRLGRARSSGIAASINQARRNRMRSYVISELVEEHEAEGSAELQKQRKRLGELGELEVVQDLESKGYEAARMPPNNPGYDIEAKNRDTGEIIYIEVKGDSYNWSEKGVGITSTQYREAINKGGSFFLAVVENLRSHPRKVYYLQDPIAYISEYRFDSNWAALSTEIPAVVVSSTENVVDQIKELTASIECKKIIDYCQLRGYPLPEVGAPITGHNGEVLVDDLELAWAEEKLCVVCDEQQREQALEHVDDWQLYLDTEISAIEEKLDAIFQQEQ